MNYTIKHQPSYALLEVELEPGETLVTESGAMAAMSKQIKLEPKLSTDPKASGGTKAKLFAMAMIRKMLGGESFFVTHFTTPEKGKVYVAPTFEGDIVYHRLENSSLYLSSSAYLASVGSLNVGIKWGGLKGLLSKEGLFQLHISGTGDLWFNSFGGVEMIDVDGEYIIDNGHLVAWEPTLEFKMQRAGKGLTSLVASGEGLVCKFSGKGKVYIQTRNLESFADWINSFY